MAVLGVSTVSIVTNDGKATLFETSFTNDDNDLTITDNEQKNALDVLDRALKDKLGKGGKVLFVPTDAHIEICEGTSRVRHYIPWVGAQQFKKVWIDPVKALAANPAVRFATPVKVDIEVKIDGGSVVSSGTPAATISTAAPVAAGATSLPPTLPPAYEDQGSMDAIFTTLKKADLYSAKEFLVVWSALSKGGIKKGVAWDQATLKKVANQKIDLKEIDVKWNNISEEDATKRIKAFVGHILFYPKKIESAVLFRNIEGNNFTSVLYFEGTVITAAREKLKVVNPALQGEFEKIVAAFEDKKVANSNPIADAVKVLQEKFTGLSEADAKKTVNGFLSYLQWVQFLTVGQKGQGV